MRRPRTRRASSASPELLILTNERDFSADEVIRRIDPERVSIRRLNIEEATAARAWTWSPQDEASDLRHVRAVWWRQFVLNRMSPSVGDIDDSLVERSQWRTFVSAVDRPDVAWVNPLWASRRAENKIEQLRTALRVGFNVPPTLVTNDPEQARSFLQEQGECIVKSLAPAYFEFSDESFVFTEHLTDDLLEDASTWYRQPVIVQKRIPREVDVRITAVEDSCFGAATASRGSDWRKHASEVVWDTWECPRPLALRCRRYLKAMGLRYAAFDFATSQGIVWFLEANQAGEWLFIDRPLRLGIADVLAASLTDLALRS